MAGIVISIIIVVATVAIYLLGLSNIWDNAICWISLVFLVLSEIIFGTALVVTKKTVFKVGMIIVSALYWIATVGIAAVFMLFFMEYTKSYILANLLLIALAAVIAILLYISANHIEKTQDHY